MKIDEVVEILVSAVAVYGGLYDRAALEDLTIRKAPKASFVTVDAAINRAIASGLLEPVSRMPGRFTASRKALGREFGQDYLTAIDSLTES